MKQEFAFIRICLLLFGLVFFYISSFAQGVIINQNGTISVQTGSTIINSNGSISTVHGSIIVNSDGSHAVIAGSSVINANGTISTIASPLLTEKDDDHPFSDTKELTQQRFSRGSKKRINISSSQKLKQHPSLTLPVESFSHPVSTDPFQLNNRKVSEKNDKPSVRMSN